MTALFHHGWGALGSVVWLMMLGMASLNDILVVTVSGYKRAMGRFGPLSMFMAADGCFRSRYSPDIMNWRKLISATGFGNILAVCSGDVRYARNGMNVTVRSISKATSAMSMDSAFFQQAQDFVV
jgi:hypothetical protein